VSASADTVLQKMRARRCMTDSVRVVGPTRSGVSSLALVRVKHHATRAHAASPPARARSECPSNGAFSDQDFDLAPPFGTLHPPLPARPHRDPVASVVFETVRSSHVWRVVAMRTITGSSRSARRLAAGPPPSPRRGRVSRRPVLVSAGRADLDHRVVGCERIEPRLRRAVVLDLVDVDAIGALVGHRTSEIAAASRSYATSIDASPKSTRGTREWLFWLSKRTPGSRPGRPRRTARRRHRAPARRARTRSPAPCSTSALGRL
jgi:hypothetical protein